MYSPYDILLNSQRAITPMTLNILKDDFFIYQKKKKKVVYYSEYFIQKNEKILFKNSVLGYYQTWSTEPLLG